MVLFFDKFDSISRKTYHRHAIIVAEACGCDIMIVHTGDALIHRNREGIEVRRCGRRLDQ